ncbi:MAG TPA: efflux RND transporter periplasmic adaptor subunit [Polyangiaceae bacterium]|nr:efflux RND transporter periplasmic adaptor subunit [Polyangiaceae bacterium]
MRIRIGGIVLAWLPACSSSPPPYAGFIDAPVAAVASQVAGRVEAIAVREGDAVKKDQVLAQLDARERQAAVAQAEANLDQVREALKEAEATLRATTPTVRGAGADIAQAQATLDEAQVNYDRTKRLVESGAEADAALVTSRARMLEAKAHLDSLTATRTATVGRVTATEAAVADARAAVTTAVAALELAKVELAEAQVLCPFDGVVVQRNLEPGEWAAPGTPVVTVEDRSQLWVRLDIEETKLRGLRLADPANVRVLAEPDHAYPGHVLQIGAEGDFAVNRDVKRGRPDIRTFLVRVAIDAPSPSLRPGMTAEVSIPSLAASSQGAQGRAAR